MNNQTPWTFCAILTFVLLTSGADAICFPSVDLKTGSQAKRNELVSTVVYNGEDANARNGSFPFWRSTVMIKMPQNQCTGTIISPTLILTAAHCVFHLSPSDITVTFRNGFDGSERQINVAQFADGERPSSPYQVGSDAAVLRLERPIPDGFSPIPIFEASGSFHFENDRVFTAGYGSQDGQRVVDYSRTLKFAELRYDRYQSTGVVFKSKGWSHSGMCWGDSGGPIILLHNTVYYVAGINSTAGNNENCGIESVAVPIYAGWVHEKVLQLISQVAGNFR